MPPDLSPAELLRESRELLDRARSAAASIGTPPELVRELLEAERAMQREIVGRLLGPADAIFDLLEQSGAALRQQAHALEEAGHALGQTAALMKIQAELFERSIATLREPAELAKAVSGMPRGSRLHPRPEPEPKPARKRAAPKKSTAGKRSAAKKPGATKRGR